MQQRREVGRTSALIDRHPVATFFTIALGITWLLWPAALLAVGDRSNAVLVLVTIPGAFGPAIAAVAVTWLTGGSVRQLLAGVLRWRVAPKWYVVAFVGLPTAWISVQLAVEIALVPESTFSLDEPSPGLFLIAAIVTAFLFGGQEEIGWRGFAQPRLQSRYSALTASVIVGVVWAAWHVPLFVFAAGTAIDPGGTPNLTVYTAGTIALSITLAWVYNSTGGSILLAMLVHGVANNHSVLVPAPPLDLATADLLETTGFVAVALVVIALFGHRTLSSGPLPGSGRAGVPASGDGEPAD